MEGNFPQLSNINPEIRKTIQSRIGKNIGASKLKPWVRIISPLDDYLILESIPYGDSFGARYGDYSKSGAVGKDKAGNPVYAEEDAATKRGLRPSPTIESIGITNGSQGLSKKITFSIKCYTLSQTEKILSHFQEPGFTILVEIGWNTKESYAQRTSMASICDIVLNNSLKHLSQKRKKSKGTYDAFLGYITAGSMKYGESESFIVDVELTTTGEIPMYLQTHKGSAVKSTSPENETGKEFKPTDLRAAVKDPERIGEALFMQMYKDLPTSKKTAAMQKIKDEVDPVTGLKYSDVGNFLNMDDDIREMLTDDVSGGKLRAGDGNETLKVPDGVPIIGQERFIRMNLALKIINTSPYEFVTVKDACVNDSNVSNEPIETTRVICRAHPYMFSTDRSKLFIPNKNMPNINIENVFRYKGEGEPQPFLDESKFVKGSPGGDDLIDVHPETTSDKTGTYFPDIRTLAEAGDPEAEPLSYDSDYDPYVCNPGYWGYLDNLFVNYDFFLSVINRSGLTNKDILIDLCNGLSSAVNMHWDFQIPSETPSKLSDNGELKPKIKDYSFCGNAKTSTVTTFQSRGLDSPFLDCNLDFDLPGAMKNQIIGKRLSGKSESVDEISVVSEAQRISMGSLFSNKVDPVLTRLNSIKINTNNALSDEEEEINEDDEKQEAVNANYALFTQKAGIYPAEQDRDGNIDVEKNWYDFISDSNRTTIGNLFRVCVWEDSNLLKRIELKHDLPPEEANSVILPIKFDFTTHGVSGLRVGDVFKISDLPKKYRESIFQIMRIEHSVDGNLWQTKVEAQIRNQKAIT